MASSGDSIDKRSCPDKIEKEPTERFIPGITDKKTNPSEIERLIRQRAVMEQLNEFKARGAEIRCDTGPRAPVRHDASAGESQHVHTSKSIILEITSTEIMEENEESRERFPVENGRHSETFSGSDASMTHPSRGAIVDTPTVGESLKDYMRRRKEEEALEYKRRRAARGSMWDETASDDGEGGHSRPNVLRKQRSKSVSNITEIKGARPHPLINTNAESHGATPGSTGREQSNVLTYNMPAENTTYVKTRRGRWRRIARFFVPSAEATTQEWASTPSHPQLELQTRPESRKPSIIRRLGRLLMGQMPQNEFDFY